MFLTLLDKNLFIERAIDHLTFGLNGFAGRNFKGRITVFHKSNPLKTNIRPAIDYKRVTCAEGNLFTSGKIVTHTSWIGALFYFVGFVSMILVPNKMEIGDPYKGFCFNFTKKEFYATFLTIMPTGTWVHHVESKPLLGGIFGRAAGVGVFLYSKWESFVYVKLPSGRLIQNSKFSVCVNGLMSNKDHHITRVPNAGANRRLGIRPTVRGVAMNPVDHPHGGGEGKKPKPVIQKTPWGKRAKDVKTVEKKEDVKIPV